MTLGQEGAPSPVPMGGEIPEMHGRMCVFVVEEPNKNEKSYVFSLEQLARGIKVGRMNDCDIAVEESSVSRNHSVISFEDNKMVIRGTGKNGTSVNGHPIAESAIVKAGDLMELGIDEQGVYGCRISFYWKNDAEGLSEKSDVGDLETPAQPFDVRGLLKQETRKFNLAEGREGEISGETAEGKFIIYTNRGHHKQQNEDSVGVLSEEGYFVVADGVSRSKNGQVAGSVVVEESERLIMFGMSIHDPKFVSSIAEEQKRRIDENPNLKGMSSTLAAFQIKERLLKVNYCGDSRIRVYGQAGELKYITSDHSVKQSELSTHAMGLGKGRDNEVYQESLDIDAESAGSSIIVRAVAPHFMALADHNLVKVDDVEKQITPKGRIMSYQPEVVQEVSLDSKDIVIASSDGFDLDEKEIARIIKESNGDTEKMYREFVAACSGWDNITIVIYTQN